MAAKTKPAPTVADAIESTERQAYEEANGVTLPLSVAEKIIDLYGKLNHADAHFQTCQSAQFRQYARSVLQAPNVVKAIDDLKALVQK